MASSRSSSASWALSASSAAWRWASSARNASVSASGATAAGSPDAGSEGEGTGASEGAASAVPPASVAIVTATTVMRIQNRCRAMCYPFRTPVLPEGREGGRDGLTHVKAITGCVPATGSVVQASHMRPNHLLRIPCRIRTRVAHGARLAVEGAYGQYVTLSELGCAPQPVEQSSLFQLLGV